MDLNDEKIRELYRNYIFNRKSGNRNTCPPIEDLVSFFNSKKRNKRKMRIVDHITCCSACAKDFYLLLELERFEEGLAAGAQDAQPIISSHLFNFSAKGLFWKLSSFAIGITLAVISLGIIINQLAREYPIRTARVSINLIHPKSASLIMPPYIFKWQATAGAIYYILELYDASLLPFWKSPAIMATAIALPDKIVIRFKPRRTYYWAVTAYGNDGKLAESGFFQFSIP